MKPSRPTEKRKKIPPALTAIFYDFDGVMTDNTVLVLSDGREMVRCHRGDGWAVGRIKQMGIHQCVISTEKNPVVQARAEKLKIPCVQGSDDKGKSLLDYAKKNNIDLSRSAYVGNDENDIPAFRLVGFRIAPLDASPTVLSLADLVVPVRGGQGVIREMLNYITDKED